MLKQLEDIAGRLASIDGSLAAVAKVCTILVREGLLEKLVNYLPELLDQLMPPEEADDSGKHVAAPEEETFSEAEAERFLGRGERQLRRYRTEGRVAYYKDDNGYIRYLKSDLERLFEEVHGFPKGGFRNE